MLNDHLARLPLAAILRGIAPAEALAIGAVLVEAGFNILEVPLNSPEPLRSIGLLHEHFGDRCLVGAGTVTHPDEIASIRAAGGRLIVMPHADPAVIRAAKAAGLVVAPGIATPTEGFAALAAGADALKLFPAELLGPSVLRALRAVFPAGTAFLPVGGITPDNMVEYVRAGATGFGLGSGLYAPGRVPDEVGHRARRYAAAWAQAATAAAITD